MQEEKQEMLKVGALWKRIAKSGEEYFGGNINFDFIVCANRFKRDSKDPDLIVFAKKKKKKEGLNVGIQTGI